MKTLLKTTLATVLTALVLSATMFTSSAAVIRSSTVIAAANPEIKKVIVTGSAKVYLVQSKYERVLLEDGSTDKISIRQEGNILRINSTEEMPTTIIVYVKDLFRIEASNTAFVTTSGKFNVKYLQVMLKDDARARVKANTEGLYTVINDRSNLELMGSTDDHILKTRGIAKLKMDKFDALKTNYVPSEVAVARNAGAADRN